MKISSARKQVGRKVEMLLSTLNTSIKSPNPHPIDTKLKLRSQIAWKEHSQWHCVQKARGRLQPFLCREEGGWGGQ